MAAGTGRRVLGAVAIAAAVAGLVLGVAARASTTRCRYPTTAGALPVAAQPAMAVPDSAVRIAAGDDVQAAVDAAPPGSAFVLAAGVHPGASIVPRDGDRFFGEDGAVLDGGDTTAVAFSGTAADVVVSNLEIRHYASPLQQGAIQPIAGETPAERWTLEHLDVHDNAGGGVFVPSDSVLRDSRVHHNGQIGLKSALTEGATVERVEVDHNNTGGHDAGWEAGGSKFAYTTDLTVRDSWVHDNAGPGLWTDIDNRGTRYEGNVVTDNDGAGIFHEISYDAVVVDNQVWRNGLGSAVGAFGAGIQIAASADVEVSANQVVGNGNGITGIQQPRGPEYRLERLDVHGNEIICSGRNGIVRETGDPVFGEAGNRFRDNAYQASTEWLWDDTGLDWAGWQDAGQDAGGTASPGLSGDGGDDAGTLRRDPGAWPIDRRVQHLVGQGEGTTDNARRVLSLGTDLGRPVVAISVGIVLGLVALALGDRRAAVLAVAATVVAGPLGLALRHLVDRPVGGELAHPSSPVLVATTWALVVMVVTARWLPRFARPLVLVALAAPALASLSVLHRGTALFVDVVAAGLWALALVAGAATATGLRTGSGRVHPSPSSTATG